MLIMRSSSRTPASSSGPQAPSTTMLPSVTSNSCHLAASWPFAVRYVGCLWRRSSSLFAELQDSEIHVLAPVSAHVLENPGAPPCHVSGWLRQIIGIAECDMNSVLPTPRDQPLLPARHHPAPLSVPETLQPARWKFRRHLKHDSSSPIVKRSPWPTRPYKAYLLGCVAWVS